MDHENKPCSSIVIAASLWDRLYQHLIRVTPEQPNPNEELVYLFASLNVSPFGLRVVVHDMLPATSSDFAHQNSGCLELKRSFVAKALKQCWHEGWSLIEVHSHPLDMSTDTTFSQIDEDYDTEAMPSFSFLLGKNFIFASMVVGQKSLDAHFYDPTTQQIIPFQKVIIVGRSEKTKSALSHIPTTSSPKLAPVPSRDRDHRQELFFGKEVQRRLLDMTIAVVGVGGLGSIVALWLAHIGVGHLILVDPDVVEETNLNRLAGVGPSDIGKEKVSVFAKFLKQVSPSIRITPLAHSLLTEQAVQYVKGVDILVGCVDNDAARLILNQVAVRYLIPLIDGATGVERSTDTENTALFVGGQVQVVLPGTRCLQCAKTIDVNQASLDLKSKTEQAFDRAHGYNTGEVAPAVIFLNGVVASHQVAEILQLLAEDVTGSKKPSLTLYDALQGKLTPVPLRASVESCSECGRVGMASYGDLAPIRFASDTLSLSVTTIKQAKTTGE